MASRLFNTKPEFPFSSGIPSDLPKETFRTFEVKVTFRSIAGERFVLSELLHEIEILAENNNCRVLVNDEINLNRFE
jgi:hypothetical protein